jgi:hypothetical protein
LVVPIFAQDNVKGRRPERRDAKNERNVERDQFRRDQLREEGKEALLRRETSAEERIRLGRESENNRNEQRYGREKNENDRKLIGSDRAIDPRIETGNLKQGWVHIEARHINGDHPTKGAGDLFAPGTTRGQLERTARELVRDGERVSDPRRRIQVFEKQIEVNGRTDRVRVVVDSLDNNRVITIYPVRSK